MNAKSQSLRSFLEASPFPGYLERCWNGSYYQNFPVGQPDSGADRGGVNAQALFFLTYSELLGLSYAIPGRAGKLAQWLAALVREDGYCLTADGFSDHPAYASTIGDALGTVAFYAAQLKLSEEQKSTVIAALNRLISNHPRLRFPEGAQGKTQQLRFELRVYYWMSLLSADPVWKERFAVALDRGIHRYTHPAAIDGPILQPSLNPDWTWNYVCTGGITDQHATNTHTPAYYCTEPNGFMFVYLHALKHGGLKRRADFDWLCGNYIEGLPRNLSRAGHLASDLDGYGIHRAWYGPVLSEGLPLESAALALQLGKPEYSAMLRWYVDRYVDFLKRSPEYAATGLPTAQPYGQQIGIEAQFCQLAGVRVYSSIARALYEFDGIDELPAREPSFFASYAWEAQWLRVSTPVYETSFAGYTCLRNIPVVPCYGDPDLGTLIGGAPLATLFSKNELLQAASFPAASLWHLEVDDHNGRRFLSCSTSPEDETNLTVRRSTGELLDVSGFDPYEPPCNLFLNDGEFVELSWRRRERQNKFAFHVRNRYYADHLDLEFGMSGMPGHYYDRLSFVLPLPAETAEASDDGEHFFPLTKLAGETLPAALRWSCGSRRCTVRVLALAGAEDPGAELAVRVVELPTTPGMPGGINSFSPHRSSQVRLEVIPAVTSRVWRLKLRLEFSDC